MIKIKKMEKDLGLFSLVWLVIFIIINLCQVIDWSWLWVLSPFWIIAGIAVIIILGLLIFAYIVTKKLN